MSQTKLDPKTQAAWKEYQQKLKKSQQYHQEQRRKSAQAEALKAKQAEQALRKASESHKTQNNQPTPRFTEEQTKKILQGLDIDRPARTWTALVTNENVIPFCQMVTQSSLNLSKPIWQKFTQKPLRLNPNALTPEQLMDKNRAIVESKSGENLFNDLVNKLYFSSLPQDFQQKFKSNKDYSENALKGYVGWSIFGLVYIKINRKKEWNWVSKINHVWPKSLFLVGAGFYGLNKYLEWNDSKFVKENVQIVETCLDTHLRLLQAHGTDLDGEFKKLLQKEVPK